jgi:YggT family protein
MIVLAARAVLSWFPMRSGTVMAQVSSILFDVTEWALRPLRRVIPPVGMFDLSFFVLFLFLWILRGVVCQ